MKELHRSNSLSEEFFRALQVDEIGSKLVFLPTLQELVSELNGLNEASLFGSFIHTREVADRPVRLSFPYSRLTRRLNPAPMPLFGRSGEVRTDQDSWITSADVTKDELIPISSEGTTRGGVRVVGKFNRLDRDSRVPVQTRVQTTGTWFSCEVCNYVIEMGTCTQRVIKDASSPSILTSTIALNLPYALRH